MNEQQSINEAQSGSMHEPMQNRIAKAADKFLVDNSTTPHIDHWSFRMGARWMENELLVGPVRVQRSRRHKQFSPNGLPIVYVGRPTKWGNPFKVTGEDGRWFVINDYDEPLVSFINKEDAIACCVENYKEYISREHNLGIKNISDLVGKNLSCWCPKNCLCHADILLELATKVTRHNGWRFGGAVARLEVKTLTT